MSRISEALRQARQDANTSIGVVEDARGGFTSAWQLEDQADAHPDAGESAVSSPEQGLDPLGTDARVGGFASQWTEQLVVAPTADWMLVEQFRRLAATLHQAQEASNIKVLLVTSASPGDGKTLTAINLALILSESYGRNVLLIDADLRRPSIRDGSHLSGVLGLSEGLRSLSEQKLTVFKVTKNLTLLPAGRPDPDPMSGLTSPRMRRIIDDASSRFEWVILDAPPLGTVADASLLAAMSDGALFVVRAQKTQCPLVLKAIEALGRERILGVVLNDVERGKEFSYGKYYGSDSPHLGGRS